MLIPNIWVNIVTTQVNKRKKKCSRKGLNVVNVMKSRKQKSGKNECIKALERKKNGTKEAWKIARKNKKIWKNGLKTKEKTKDYIYVKIESFFFHSYLNTKKKKMELNCGKAIEYFPTIIQVLQMAQCYIV